MFGHLKINRAISTRYNKLANSFLSMVPIDTATYWLKFVHAVSELASPENPECFYSCLQSLMFVLIAFL